MANKKRILGGVTRVKAFKWGEMCGCAYSN